MLRFGKGLELYPLDDGFFDVAVLVGFAAGFFPHLSQFRELFQIFRGKFIRSFYFFENAENCLADFEDVYPDLYKICFVSSGEIFELLLLCL